MAFNDKQAVIDSNAIVMDMGEFSEYDALEIPRQPEKQTVTKCRPLKIISEYLPVAGD